MGESRASWGEDCLHCVGAYRSAMSLACVCDISHTKKVFNNFKI